MSFDFREQLENALRPQATKLELKGKTACVTGATSGIGLATAVALAAEGCSLILSGRRGDRLEELKSRLLERHPQLSISILAGDMREATFVDRLVAVAGPSADILINNAGLARRADPVAAAQLSDWEEMIQTNVIAAFRLVRGMLPYFLRKGSGHIVNMGSLAGRLAYEGGSVYCATKHALKAFTEALRQETCGTGVRITLISPGMVDSEFSLVRFHGDEAKADQVYRGMVPLIPSDIARHILFALQEPTHVNIDEIFTMPMAQGSPQKVQRK